MLEITIPEGEFFIESTGEFIHVKETKLQLEHSLISVRKWESKWHKPFLSARKNDEKTLEETIDYIRCMTLNKGINPDMYFYMPPAVIDEIVNYIHDPHTATWFASGNDMIGAQKSKNEIVTAEIIYWWMVDLGIPIELERWPLNQLLTLIKVINEKHSPKKKRSPMEIMMENDRLNKERRAKMGTKG